MSFFKNIFGFMKPGEYQVKRIIHRTDPDKDRTEIIYAGSLSARKVQDIKDILSGKSTAHRRPGKTARKGNEIFGLVGR